ncbi:MAG: hypothetical protein FWC26_15160 [Fibromonadales bacterium]|nr:hypothetical protein [Fibromonadales bacterium]
MENNNITIQLRYCFDDKNLHSMNAEIFNECEKQFIKAIKSIEKYLEYRLLIDIKPREEGSLIDTFSVTINNPVIVPTVMTLIAIFVTKFLDSKFSSAKHKIDETNDKLKNIKNIKEDIKKGILTESDFDYIASSDKDLRRQKSNFFKNVKKEEKITHLETKTITNPSIQPIIMVVNKENFSDFILPEEMEIVEDIQQVKIYIVAPILMRGRKDSWKGMLDNNNIDFRITDGDFLEQVWSQLIKFRNGTFINCDLKIVRTTNIETGEIKISREVIKVTNYSDDDKQVKKITHRKKFENNENKGVQLRLPL